MRRLMTIAMLLSLFLLGGCDFLRTIAGRPTSAELAAMESENVSISEYESLVSSPDTSVQENVPVSETIVDAIRDSMDVFSHFLSLGVQVRKVSQLNNVNCTHMTGHYCVILACLSVWDNAVKLADKVTKSGYKPILMEYASGKTLVGVCLPDETAELETVYDKLHGEPFCPSDAWILFKD